MPSIWPPGYFGGGSDRPIGAPINWDHPQAYGLVLALPFWDRGGTRAEDASGNGHYWTPTTPSWPVDSVFGPVVKTTDGQFAQGTNNLIAIADQVTTNGVLLQTNVFVSAWVNVISFSESPFGSTGVGIFGTRTSGGNFSPSLVINNDNGHGGGNAGQGAMFVVDSNSLAQGARGATPLSVGTWYHIAGSFRDPVNGTFGGDWRVYLNGRLDSSAANNYSLAGGVGATAIFTGNPWSAGGNSMLMADLRVYRQRSDHAWLAQSLYDPSSRWALYQPSVIYRAASSTQMAHPQNLFGGFVNMPGGFCNA